VSISLRSPSHYEEDEDDDTRKGTRLFKVLDKTAKFLKNAFAAAIRLTTPGGWQLTPMLAVDAAQSVMLRNLGENEECYGTTKPQAAQHGRG